MPNASILCCLVWCCTPEMVPKTTLTPLYSLICGCLSQLGFGDLTGDAASLHWCNGVPRACVPHPTWPVAEQTRSALQLLREMPVTRKYSLPVLLVEHKSHVRGERRHSFPYSFPYSFPAAVPGSDWPQGGSRRVIPYSGSVGGPIPAVCPQGTPLLPSHR